jgi:hypothetical protein
LAAEIGCLAQPNRQCGEALCRPCPAETAAELAKHVTSGDVAGIVGTVPEALRTSVWQIGNAAFADGFAAAALLAATVAAAMALFTVLLVRRAETLPVGGDGTHLPASME